MVLPCSLLLQFLYHLTRSVGDISNGGIFKVFYYFRLNYISIYFVSAINGSPFVRSTTELDTKGIDAEKYGDVLPL